VSKITHFWPIESRSDLICWLFCQFGILVTASRRQWACPFAYLPIDWFCWSGASAIRKSPPIRHQPSLQILALSNYHSHSIIVTSSASPTRIYPGPEFLDPGIPSSGLTNLWV